MRNEGHLLRVLGLAFGLAAVVGSIVGQGILRTPGIVALASGSTAVILGLWVLGALIALAGTFPLAELGSAIPRAGGAFAFTARAFGARAGAFVGYASLMAFFTATAQVSYVLGELLVRAGVGGGAWSAGQLALAAIAIFSILNALGTRFSGISQVVFSALKGLFLVGLVIAFLGHDPVPPAITATPLPGGWLAFGTAMLLITSAYNGWADVVFFGEEVENPGRVIPRAMFGGIIGVAAIYLLVNFAMLHLLQPSGIAGSDFAAADAAKVVFGARGDQVLIAFGILSVGAISSLQLMVSSRVVYAAARAELLPKMLVKVGERGTPIRAMLLVALLSGAFIATGTYIALSSAAVSIYEVPLMAAILSAIALRVREPNLARPFRSPWAPVIFPLALAINLALLAVFVVEDPVYSLSGFVLVAIFFGIHLIFVRGASAPPAVVEPV